jgi:hypothetical protein
MPSRCAIWARVSTDEQESSNQLSELRQWAARRGLEIAAEYVVDGASAWKGEHRDQLVAALTEARRKAEGKPIGRRAGSQDRRPRRRSGYYARWERERTMVS